MKPLERALRGQLERVAREARDVAEAAAASALEQLGVCESAPFTHQSESERELRRKLRIHGRQLGDTLNGGKIQSMDRLIEEVAYEHWHRMLFARFLAENNLLMYPDQSNPVPVTLEECEDLAAKEGAKNGWALAAIYAARMLPQIFRVDSPVFQLDLPPEHQQKLERLVAGLPVDVFLASDSLGWVYQFWQAKKKDEVNASEVKIGARELPAVTQLFTEPYMVSFLLDNSLGAWWATRKLTTNDFAMAKSEEELRSKASLPGVPLEYLRFTKEEGGLWTPASGSFDNWPEEISNIKILDPSCGSGHFLVAAFLMLVALHIELKKLSAKEAINVVLRDNLHGLEIDQRCVELAVFALALAAWRYPNSGGYRQLPELSIACSGLAISAKKEDWIALADNDPALQFALETLYRQFKNAPEIGSLINLEIGLSKGSLFELKWADINPLIAKAIADEKDSEKIETGVIAHGIAKAAAILAHQYTLVITNVPYLGIRRQSDFLKEYNSTYHAAAKGDLATVFLDKFLRNNTSYGGFYSVVTPSALASKDYFKNLRKEILENYTIKYIAFLGPRAFETITGEVVDVLLLAIEKRVPGQDETFSLFDVYQGADTEEKAIGIKSNPPITLLQRSQLVNPDSRIQPSSYGTQKLLLDYCDCPQGIKTGDDEKWIRMFWEVACRNKWEFCQSSSVGNKEFGGLERIIDWSTNGKGMIRPRLNSQAVGKWAVGLSQTGQKRPVLFVGARFDSSIAPILPRQPSNLLPIWTFCSSSEFIASLEQNSRGLFTTNTALLQVPFDIQYWTKIAHERYPCGLPKLYSNDPTQWIFHGHPGESDESLQVAVARLLGYRWPAEMDFSMELSEEAHSWAKKSEYLLPYADEDGIVCIPSIRGEAKAEYRLENLMAAAYGSDWSSRKKAELLAQVGYAGKSLESWLREKFFTQHCKVFHDRPFIWHVWDGLSDGFASLVNYHKLDAKKLEILIYNYLGDWISRQKQDIDKGVDGAGEKLAAAEGLKERLELILEGEAPYDIFVRWKPLGEQPVGWNPDLNDGVRLNIRPFLSVPDVGKKGAGVLRDRPNIKWDKDRGKDAESSPWYRLFKGERINDHHLNLAEKRKAREEKIIG